MADMPKSDIGVKLSQPLYDAETASDRDLIFSSSFPLLKEERTGVFNRNGLSHSGESILVYEHKLGYYPFFAVFDDQSKMRFGTEWQVDETRLYFTDNSTLFPPVGSTGNFRWVVYRLPIFTVFESTNKDVVSPTASSAYDPDFGFKFAKEGASVDSTDLRDFMLHSRGRSPLIHSVSVKDWAAGSTVESHSVSPGFSYNPIAFAFTLNRSSTKAYNMQNGGQATPRLTRSNQTIQVNSTGNTTRKSSIVVLKDPFLAPKTLQVVY